MQVEWVFERPLRNFRVSEQKKILFVRNQKWFPFQVSEKLLAIWNRLKWKLKIGKDKWG